MDNIRIILAKYYEGDYFSTEDIVDYFMDYTYDENGNLIHLEIFDGEYETFPIRENIIEFVGEFKKLKSISIDIGRSEIIKDLKPLADLYDLEYIWIDIETEVDNLNFVKELEKLKQLSLKDSNIQNIDILSEYKELITLWLPNANIDDISVLSNMPNLETLNLANSNVANIDSLEFCSKLKYINFEQNNVASIEVLNHHKELSFVNFQHNKIQDDFPLRYCTKLVNLNLSNNQIQKIELTQNVSNLTILNVSGNQLENIDFSNCPKLINLDISNNQIEDINSLKNCTSLVNLNIADNQIKAIEVISNNQKIAELNISNNPIQSLKAVASLNALTSFGASNLSKEVFYEIEKFKSKFSFLDLSYCDLNNVSFLSNQVQLQALKLNDNNLNDYRWLKDLPYLRHLNLRNNQLNNMFPIHYCFWLIQSVDLRGGNFEDRIFAKPYRISEANYQYPNFYTDVDNPSKIEKIDELVASILEFYDEKETTKEVTEKLGHLRTKAYFNEYGEKSKKIADKVHQRHIAKLTEKYKQRGNKKIAGESQISTTYQKPFGQNNEGQLEDYTYSIIFISMLLVLFGVIGQILYKTDSLLITTLFTIIFLPLTIFGFALLVDYMEKDKEES